LVVNNDNICVENKSYFVKNVDVLTYGVLVESNSLADLPSLKDITPIINSLLCLQYLDSAHSSSIM